VRQPVQLLAMLRITALCGLWLSAPACAQGQKPANPPAAANSPAGFNIEPSSGDAIARKLELDAVETSLKTGEAERARLKIEIDQLAQDRNRLMERLADVAKRVQAQESKIIETENRLTLLGQTETAIRQSLENRRASLSHILASLQRMGRKPLPAILVKPEDVLEALHASLMMGAVLPDMQAETTMLATDLGELIRLRELDRRTRDLMQADLSTLVTDRQELAALTQARQRDVSEREKGLEDERKKADALVQRAQSLKELMTRFEADDDARRRANALSNDPKARELGTRLAAASGKDGVKLAARAPFNELRGALPWPVSGTVLRGFNANDGNGGQMRGMAIGTRQGAIVTTPADGTVSYAGTFRGYGQLLIINAGNGYYVLLAGLERITVSIGQFVIMGEPVAQMGQDAKAILVASGDDATRPVLYVEFRKDGSSIDPAPWWVPPQTEKVRG
jgi:septal ring factor EnvC (AmiA/AmiB activator)